MGIGDWGLGIGDWVLGPIPNPQSPIPNPQSPIPIFKKLKNIKYFINYLFKIYNLFLYKIKVKKIKTINKFKNGRY